jgi:hypothetical protein
MIQRMWEILTTLTEEAQNASLTKAKELAYSGAFRTPVPGDSGQSFQSIPDTL